MNILKTYKKTVKYETQIIEVVPGKVNLRVRYENGKLRSQLLELAKGHEMPSWMDFSPHFQMVTPQFFKDIKVKHYTEIGEKEHIVKHPLTVVEKVTKVDPKTIVIFYGSGHLFFDVDFKPISSAMDCEYIGGVTNLHYHLDKVREHFKDNPKIVSFKDHEIEYYNRGTNYTHAVQFRYCVPQAMMTRVWNKALETGDPTPFFRHRFLPHSGYSQGIDALGLKKCLRKDYKEREREAY